MNIISNLRSKQKTLMIAASLLFGLALTPTASIAANAKHEGYRNNDVHHTNQQQGSRHAEKNKRHHNKHASADHRYNEKRGHNRHKRNKHASADRHYNEKRGHNRHNRNKHRNHYYSKPHYALSSQHHHRHPDLFGLQVGVHAGNFNIFVRD
ncbi:MAG: hypothetical protein ACJAT7_000216 [Psychromonas sp.]|jgi:hypothetical protein|uniref:hypothetical protein n=1 Tax=Psychromonas sp. TaxID=1884585 RepID=UPI0039E3DEAD